MRISVNRARALERAAIAVIALMFVSLIAVLSMWLVSSYRTTVTRGNEQVTAASRIVAANAVWMNSLARQTLHRIDDSLDSPTANPDRVHDLNLAVADLPSQVSAYVLAPDGHTLFTTDRGIDQVDVTDPEYFSRLRNGAEDYVSDMLTSRTSGDQIFVFGRRLERDGQFAGIATISFDADMLRPVWDSVALGPSSAVALLRRDGKLIARHPQPAGAIDMHDFVLFNDYAKKATSGLFEAISPIDGRRRVMAYVLIERTPFVATASADVDTIMQPFWWDAKTASVLVILAMIGAIAAAVWIRNLVRADETHRDQLVAALQTNQVLLREVHHRVKNNLQTVIALLRIQGFDPKAVEEINARIAAMSAVHEQMYGLDEFKGLAAREFIPTFVGRLVEANGLDIETDFVLEDIMIAADKATPFALLLNELVTNSMKYAFRSRSGGRLKVELAFSDQGVSHLIVADDGPGYDGISEKPGMGSRLVKAFVSQMNGEYSYVKAAGTVFQANLNLG